METIAYRVHNTVLIVIYQMENASSVLYLLVLRRMVHVGVRLVLFIMKQLLSAVLVYQTAMYA